MYLESKKFSSKDSANILATGIAEVLSLMNHHIKTPREQNPNFMDNIYNKTG